ncbi:MAG: acyltransferase [Chloroflexota bacterium]|nr:acyltransferase [Chloroflexota bacterium]MBI5703901.1 acyltransferase [Chloroflexota bacterium]
MFKAIIESPWKLRNNLLRLLVHPWVRVVFLFNGIPWGHHWRFFGVPILQKHRGSQMKFGDGLQLRSTVHSNPLGANHPVVLCTWQAGAILQIGHNFAMTGGSIVAAEKIVIGDNVTVGANTVIMDTDFHSLEAEARRAEVKPVKTAPVTVEDDVFIGMNCLILKGVTLGRGSVIGAGSVVTKDVPPHTIAAGNPARVIGNVP